jgi:anti-sigma B factor antagonist
VSVGEEEPLAATWASPDQLLRVSVRTGADDRPVVALAGELDIASTEEVGARLAEALGQGKGLVVDLAELRFIDSTGITAMFIAHKRAVDAGRVMVLRAPRPNVRKTIGLIGLDKVFLIEE